VLSGHERAQLRVGEREAGGERVGVHEQQLAGRRRGREGPAPDQQRRAELALERPDLVRHRGLAARERRRRAGERAVARDLAEREQPARVQHARNLYVRRFQSLRL
jgi:hypothetical protein